MSECMQGSPGDLHIATISDMIRGGGVSSTAEGEGGGKRRGFEATFEVTTVSISCRRIAKMIRMCGGKPFSDDAIIDLVLACS